VATASLPPGARVVIATSNPGKVREIADILADRDLVLCGLEGLVPVDFPEEGGDYAQNAAAKARAAAARLGDWALADDSGLEVEALGGAPGAYSARFGGEGLDDAGRCRYLLRELAARSGASRRARFVCHMALAAPDGAVTTARGECAGSLLEAPRGRGGFGYDPIFQPDGYDLSLAELSQETKNEISHRARALRALFGLPQRLAPLRPRAGPCDPSRRT
jgi:XTP/dITP diphosphohydrolase